MREVKNIALITQGLTRVVRPIMTSNHNLKIVIEAPPRTAKTQRDISTLKLLAKRILVKLGFRQPTLKEICTKNSIRYLDMLTVSDHELADELRKAEIDLLVVYSMSSLLSTTVFTVPKLGAINLHPSYLPAYRGPNPWFWRYLNADLRGGVTVHCIDEGEDTGDILLQEFFAVPLGIKSPEIQDLAIGEIGSRLLIQAIDRFESIPRCSQSNQAGLSRARNISFEEHKSILDWDNWPIERLWHVLRGTELWLDAVDPPSGIFKGMRWNVQGYKKLEHSLPVGELGRFRLRKVVYCREGVIFLKIRIIPIVLVKNLLRLL